MFYVSELSVESTCFSCDLRFARRRMCSLSSFHSLARNSVSTMALQQIFVAVTSSPSLCCFSNESSVSRHAVRLPCKFRYVIRIPTRLRLVCS